MDASSDMNRTGGRIVLIMTVEIGDGRTDIIEVRENDDPEQLARAFCDEHELDPAVIDPLTQNIVSTLDALPSPSASPARSSATSPARTADSPGRRSPHRSSPPASRNGGDSYQQSPSRHQWSPQRQQQGVPQRARPPPPPQARPPPPDGMSAEETRQAWSDGHRAVDSRPGPMTRPQFHDQPATRARPKSAGRERASASSPTYIQQPRYFDDSAVKPQPQINPNSRRMIDRTSRKGTVFDRLHSNAQELQKKVEERRKSMQLEEEADVSLSRTGMSNVSRSLTKERAGGVEPRKNVTRLYEEGLRRLQDRNELIEKVSQQQEEAFRKEATFKPRINGKSKALAEKRESDVVSRLHRWAEEKKYSHTRADMLPSSEARELEECTFKPAITRKAEEQRAERGEALAHHLYSDWERRNMKLKDTLEKRDKEATFQPQLGPKPRKEKLKLTEAQLQQRAQRLSMRKEKPEVADDIDPVTGQPYFKPLTGRAPNKNNRAGMAVSDYLYATQAMTEKLRREKMEQEEREAREQAVQSRVAESSKRILMDARRKRLMALFTDMDDEQSGSIHPARARMDRFDPAVAQVLARILGGSDDRLTFSAFCALVESKLKHDPASSHVLFHSTSKKKNSSPTEDPCSFHPQTDAFSNELVKKRSENDRRPTWAKLLESRELAEQKRRAMAEELEKKEMENCTFSPVVRTDGRKEDRASVLSRLQTPRPDFGEGALDAYIPAAENFHLRQSPPRSKSAGKERPTQPARTSGGAAPSTTKAKTPRQPPPPSTTTRPAGRVNGQPPAPSNGYAHPTTQTPYYPPTAYGQPVNPYQAQHPAQAYPGQHPGMYQPAQGYPGHYPPGYPPPPPQQHYAAHPQQQYAVPPHPQYVPHPAATYPPQGYGAPPPPQQSQPPPPQQQPQPALAKTLPAAARSGEYSPPSFPQPYIEGNQQHTHAANFRPSSMFSSEPVEAVP